MRLGDKMLKEEWHISSYSVTGETCVAARILDEEKVQVSDTKLNNSRFFEVSPAAWGDFLQSVTS
jgi:hypothetical protein